MPLENLDDLGEVRERAGQPVDLVDDDIIDPPGLDVLEQALERRALEGAAGDPAVVVATVTTRSRRSLPRSTESPSVSDT